MLQAYIRLLFAEPGIRPMPIILRALLATCCILLHHAAYAQVSSRSMLQWQATDNSMHDYILEGYELRAVLDDRVLPPSQPPVGQRFFLQKGTSLVQCYIVPVQNSPDTRLGCSVLVKPRYP